MKARSLTLTAQVCQKGSTSSSRWRDSLPRFTSGWLRLKSCGKRSKWSRSIPIQEPIPMQQKLSTEGVLHALGSELEQIKCELESDINTITACLKRLDENVLCLKVFTTTDSPIQRVNDPIGDKWEEISRFYIERICSFNSLSDNTLMMKKIRTG